MHFYGFIEGSHFFGQQSLKCVSNILAIYVHKDEFILSLRYYTLVNNYIADTFMPTLWPLNNLVPKNV